MATLEEKLSKLEEYVKQQKSWKQEFEELKRAYEGLKIERDNLAEIVEQGSEGVEDLRNEIKQLKNRNKLLGARVEVMTKRLEEAGNDLKLYDELRSVFRRMFPKGVPAQLAPGFEPRTPSEMIVATEQPALTVQRIRQPLELSQEDLLGRIAIVYAEDLLPSNKAFTTRQLNKIMEQRFGRKEAYANFPKVLTDLVSWGFFEKVQAGKRWDYRVKMKPEVAREKDLLKIEEGKP